MNDLQPLFGGAEAGTKQWSKMIAHKGKGHQLDYTGWEPLDIKVVPRRNGQPTEEFPISKNPDNIRYSDDSEGVLEFLKPPVVSESGTNVEFTMDVEVELDLRLKATGTTVSLDPLRAIAQQTMRANIPGAMAGVGGNIAGLAAFPKVREKCHFYIEFPPPYIWHPFLPEDDKLAQPNANQPSRNDPKYLTSQDRERTGYILDTTTDKLTTCAAELRKFNPDTQLYRVTDEVMDFSFTNILHQDILQTDSPRDHCGFTLKTKRAILGRPREMNGIVDEKGGILPVCIVEMKRKDDFCKFPESPARNEEATCNVYYKWVDSIHINFILHYTDNDGKDVELYNKTEKIKHEQFEIGFKISNLDKDQTLQLDWAIVKGTDGYDRIMKEGKEGSSFTIKDTVTLSCSGEQIWKTKIKLVDNPVNEAEPLLISLGAQRQVGQVRLRIRVRPSDLGPEVHLDLLDPRVMESFIKEFYLNINMKEVDS
jgi:hypothetical protein